MATPAVNSDGVIADPLTDAEYAELERLETVISKGLDTFVEVGTALAKIKADRLYRQFHQSFDAYCREQWDLGKSRAYQLISAAEVASEMSTMVDTPQPTNERQARELGKVPAEGRADVMREAAERAGGQPTAADIASVAETHTEKVETRFKDPMSDLINDKRENDPEIHAAHVAGKFSEALVAFLNIARKLDPEDVAGSVPPSGHEGQRIERLTTELENWLNAYRDTPRVRGI